MNTPSKTETRVARLNRRHALAWLAGAPALEHATRFAAPLAATVAALLPALARAQVPNDRITVLYRRESPQAPSRTEPVVQAATLALQNEFLQRGLKVIQPSADIYNLMEQGQSVVVTFAENAGFSLVYSAYADVRPVPGQDAGIAEVRLATRVMLGRHVLVADEGRGQMMTRLEPAAREFGIRRGLEMAAKRAAAELAEKAGATLRSMTPERITELVGTRPTTATTSQVVAVPPPGAGVSVPGAVSPGVAMAPPPLAPNAVPMPAAPPSAGPSAPPPLAPAAPAPMAPAPAAPAGGPMQALPEPRQRWALVVGMSDYSGVRRASNSEIGDLPGVARDVRFVEDSLAKLGYPKQNVRVLRDAQATGTAVRGAIKELAAKSQPGDVTLMFFSGHGADKEASVSGFGMPLLADFKPNDPASLDFWELQSFAKNLRGRVVWINDTCHSGGAATNVASVMVSADGVKASMNVQGPDAKSVASGAQPGQDFAILTACAPSEYSLETAEGGLFTTQFFKQMVATRGQLAVGQVYADAVHNQVVQQSRDICRRANVCASSRQQTPTMAYNGNGHLIRV